MWQGTIILVTISAEVSRIASPSKQTLAIKHPCDLHTMVFYTYQLPLGSASLKRLALMVAIQKRRGLTALLAEQHKYAAKAMNDETSFTAAVPHCAFR